MKIWPKSKLALAIAGCLLASCQSALTRREVNCSVCDAVREESRVTSEYRATLIYLQGLNLGSIELSSNLSRLTAMQKLDPSGARVADAMASAGDDRNERRVLLSGWIEQFGLQYWVLAAGQRYGDMNRDEALKIAQGHRTDVSELIQK